MTPEDAFLQDIRETPDDDAPRLIFADWLADNGDPERGEFIRLQVCRARPGTDPGEKERLGRQAAGLLEANWGRWTAPLVDLLREGRSPYNWARARYRKDSLAQFPRGFLESIALDAAGLARVAAELFRRWPIRHLFLLQAGDGARRLVDCPELAWVETLIFDDYYRAPLDAPAMAALAGCRYLGRLRSLSLYNNHLGDQGAEALAGAGWLAGLRAVTLDDNGLSGRGVAALADTSAPFRPERLSLAANPIGDDGAEVLAASPVLAGVRRLSLANCGLGQRAAVALAASPHLGALEELDLSGNDLTPGGEAALASAPWRRRLRSCRLP